MTVDVQFEGLTTGPFGWLPPYDDGYITVTSAQALWSGAIPNYPGTPPLYGITSPVHTVLVAGARAVHGPAHSAVVVAGHRRSPLRGGALAARGAVHRFTRPPRRPYDRWPDGRARTFPSVQRTRDRSGAGDGDVAPGRRIYAGGKPGRRSSSGWRRLSGPSSAH